MFSFRATLTTGLLLGWLLATSWGCAPVATAPVQVGKELAVAIYQGYENPCWVYVRLDNPRLQPVSVSLTTLRNQPLHVERTRQYRHNVRLDVSNLENGTYRVAVSDPTHTVTRTVSS